MSDDTGHKHNDAIIQCNYTLSVLHILKHIFLPHEIEDSVIIFYLIAGVSKKKVSIGRREERVKIVSDVNNRISHSYWWRVTD